MHILVCSVTLIQTAVWKVAFKKKDWFDFEVEQRLGLRFYLINSQILFSNRKPLFLALVVKIRIDFAWEVETFESLLEWADLLAIKAIVQ